MQSRDNVAIDIKKSIHSNDNKEVFSSKRRFKWTWSIYAEKDISFGAKVVANLLAQYFYGNNTGRCDPSYEGIAKMGGMSARHVSNLIAELEDKGWLSHVRTGKRNLYSLLRVPAEASNDEPDGNAGSDHSWMGDRNPGSDDDRNRGSDHGGSDRQTSTDKPLLSSSPSRTPSFSNASGVGQKAGSKRNAAKPKRQYPKSGQWKSTGTTIPENFDWDQAKLEIAKEAGIRLRSDAEKAFRAFTADAKSKGKVMEDWNEAWRAWAINAPQTPRKAI